MKKSSCFAISLITSVISVQMFIMITKPYHCHILKYFNRKRRVSHPNRSQMFVITSLKRGRKYQ